MIEPIVSYDRLVIELRARLVRLSELDGSLVKNGISPDGSDLSEQLVTGVLTAVNLKNAVIVFYLNETTGNDNSSMVEEDGDYTLYQTYNMHVIIYGHAGMMLAPKLKARFESQANREALYNKHIHLIEVSEIEDMTEPINEVMWPRKDFDIEVSVRYDITPVDEIDDMQSAEIEQVVVDYP